MTSDASDQRRIVDGRWAVIGNETRGGMASVVKAYDLEGEHREAALKFLPAARDGPWRRKA